MSNNLLGIEIGNRRVKFAEMKNGAIRSFFILDLPDNVVIDGELIAFEAMGDLIREAVKEHHVRTRRCAVVMPDNDIYLRRMILPAMTEKQLLVNMPYEFKDILSGEKDKYIYDYSVIRYYNDENDNPKEMEIFGAVVSIECIQQYKEMFRRASLKLVKASPREIVLGTLVNELFGNAAKGDFAVLDLGYKTTRVDIFRDGIYEVTRTIEIGAERMIQAAADVMHVDTHAAEAYFVNNTDHIQEHEQLVSVYSSIAVEVMRTLNYYSYENPESELDTLYYAGGASAAGRCLTEIQDMVSLRLAPLSELAEDQEDSEAIINSPYAMGICF